MKALTPRGSGLLLIVAGYFLLAYRELAVTIPRARLAVDASPTGMAAYGVAVATLLTVLRG